ncbi:tRNA (adenosine(37)-N6)-dimethylallyltransferase MiaA [Thiomicrorhabdus lithotrophica]|uniref:tRNA dimethylallyltransferase n=1 Tax=Thiomicrorhabdus lithotrophica TaxID=2949997 RepID=A0ABY8CEC0_9GAMM|nr:tRNA (adenosine(37)-N6)-dimethylallyltransferase MiaA [Thiomicrorhabdus lithotrophica]WEJ63587.1 tRNA (adenosine(37)-N6)-dimethylallyltransferase MiaA [Thiomicrorhabdus lithotrophica]
MNLVKKLIENKQCLAIMGPTASGKSQLSMLLAEELPIEIISVDSALIYRDMDIGTAKPTQAELELVPHHLINTHDAAETYSASEFVDDVNRLVKEIFNRECLPVLVGGTMMYFNALQQGMSDLPSADEKIREYWLNIWNETPDLLHEKLLDIDPVSAERIHKNDPQRLVRAIEVYELTGKTLTEFRAEPKKGLPDFELIKVALIPEDRAKLHRQIEQRFLTMIESGFLQEAKGLFERSDLNEDMTSIRSVGYRQAWLFMMGEYDYDTFIDKGFVATRQLAKRQLTWLRKEPNITVIDPYETTSDQRVEQTLALLKLKAGA